MWNFIYKNKEVAINFETPQFSDLYKLMDAGRRRWGPASLTAAEDEGNTLRKRYYLNVSKSETKNVIHIYFIYITHSVRPYRRMAGTHKEPWAVFPVDNFANVARIVGLVQRSRKCPLEIQLMVPCEDLPHINMDENCEWYLAVHFTGLVMTNIALY